MKTFPAKMCPVWVIPFPGDYQFEIEISRFLIGKRALSYDRMCVLCVCVSGRGQALPASEHKGWSRSNEPLEAD